MTDDTAIPIKYLVTTSSGEFVLEVDPELEAHLRRRQPRRPAARPRPALPADLGRAERQGRPPPRRVL